MRFLINREVVLWGQQDKYNRIYMSQPDVFADAFNYYLYDGKQNIKPEDLHELDFEEVIV